ncbi:MAG: AEC family transporter [Anaerolineae bacterium]|nr:AEC family transporter [Anaerolineae bacterium]
MTDNAFVRTIIPIALLIGAGFLSRKMGFLKHGDERVLSAYLYYFALPALFLVNMAELDFNEEVIRYMAAGVTPVFVALILLVTLYFILRFSKNTLYLLIISTIFGSLAFFGIPFIMFAFPTREAEHLATLASATISTVIVIISITVLELYKLGEVTLGEGLKLVARRLSRNPLIASILLGTLLSLSGIEIPAPLSAPLHMLGGTTATVAIFMLGVFLYGRKYTNIALAFGLSLLRVLFLPTIAFLTTTFFRMAGVEKYTLVLMHGTPTAISMIVLSERYNFFKETVPSLILLSSMGAGLYLNLWLFVLNR